MKDVVWAVEHCFCQYETGFAVVSLHRTKALAKKAKTKYVQENCSDDGARVAKWKLDDEPATA